MYRIYILSLYLLVPLVILRLLFSGHNNPDSRKRWPERFGLTPPLRSGKPVIWVHAVSVGEIQASRPLVEYLLMHYGQFQIVVTTVTPTGAETARQLFGNAVSHRYFPYDLPFAVSGFLDVIKPQCLVIMETEIWPVLYRHCNIRSVPVALVNARLSERSFRGYRRFHKLIRATLDTTSVIAAQTQNDADRFLALGADPDKVRVMGNLKFDIKSPHSILEEAEVIRRFFSNRPVWIAASTHEGEEKPVLAALSKVLAIVPDSLLVLAPRHPQRFPQVLDMCKKSGFNTVSYSNKERYSADTRIFLLDTLGKLTTYYGAADIAFVGGSLVAAGGHNMLEPASMGVPVVCGPHLFNFTEISELLMGAEAMCRIADEEELADTVLKLFDDGNLRFNMGERARQVVKENQGSLARITRVLDTILEKRQLRGD